MNDRILDEVKYSQDVRKYYKSILEGRFLSINTCRTPESHHPPKRTGDLEVRRETYFSYFSLTFAFFFLSL